MRLLPHTGVYGLWLHQAKPTSDQGDDRSLFSSLRGGPATRAMDHWCENSFGGSSFSWLRGGPPRAMGHLGEIEALLHPFYLPRSPLRRFEVLPNPLDLPILHLGYGGVVGVVASVLDRSLGDGGISPLSVKRLQPGHGREEDRQDRVPGLLYWTRRGGKRETMACEAQEKGEAS